MQNLIEYIVAHTARGECQCGKCFDKRSDRPAPEHSVNVHFFWVSAVDGPTKEGLLALLQREYPDMDRLKRGPSYIEIGGAIGDQALALRLIGLGGLVKLWPVITPELLGIAEPEASELAGGGFVMAGGFAA
jgi:hypothetical protein